MKVVKDGENDEGDYDSWTITKISYAGNEFFTYKTDRSSNIGSAWGREHDATFNEDKTHLIIQNYSVGGTIMTGGATYDKSQEQVIDLVKAWKEKKED